MSATDTTTRSPSDASDLMLRTLRLVSSRHRINPVSDQVHEYLLELHAIRPYFGKLLVWLGLYEYPMLLEVATFQVKYFLDELIEVQ